MCAKLLILESPGKVKKVQEILGPGWKVAVSVGHVRDLPVKEMGGAPSRSIYAQRTHQYFVRTTAMHRIPCGAVSSPM